MVVRRHSKDTVTQSHKQIKKCRITEHMQNYLKVRTKQVNKKSHIMLQVMAAMLLSESQMQMNAVVRTECAGRVDQLHWSSSARCISAVGGAGTGTDLLRIASGGKFVDISVLCKAHSTLILPLRTHPSFAHSSFLCAFILHYQQQHRPFEHSCMSEKQAKRQAGFQYDYGLTQDEVYPTFHRAFSGTTLYA